MTLGPNGYETVQKHPLTDAEKMLFGAQELRRRGELEEATRVFKRIADNKKNPVNIAEEARYYEAECLFDLKRYPDACDVYHELIKDFERTPYKEQALGRMFFIANYWLDDTRLAMEMRKEKSDGKRWWVPPTWIHFQDSTKPSVGEQGRAEEALENISLADYRGPYSDMSLFLLGAVNFYDQDFKESDNHFTMLLQHHPDSRFAPEALQMAIISKYLATGGADYDGRKVAEARQMVHQVLNRYRDKLNPEQTEKVMDQLGNISYMQADKDLKTARFYERIGKPASAYFEYEIIRRRYPQTKFFDLATKKMHEIHDKAEKEAQESGKTIPPIDPPSGMATEPAANGPVPTTETPRMLPPPGPSQ
jgi:outer membrane protein assembly factor BamD (BamD/ComL family)